MNIHDIIDRRSPPEPWAEGEKIPWNDPDFSQRMLKEHLSQNHDLASRRFEMIDRHVEWIARTFLVRNPSRVLDLGCGPGFYSERLARLGHDCVGIDFSPASIEYAKSNADSAGLKIDYRLGDVRSLDYGTGYDSILFVFGEFNVFQRNDAEQILGKASNALSPGGILILEPQSFDGIQRGGEIPSCWHTHEKGLFSDSPHIWLEEHFWDADTSTSTTRFFIVDAGSGDVEKYALSNQAYTDTELQQMMTSADFVNIQQYPSLAGSREDAQKGLFVITGQKRK